MLQAEDPFVHRKERGEQVLGGGSVSCLASPEGELMPGGQSVGVLRAQDPFPCVKDSPLEIPGGGVSAAVSQVIGNPGGPVAVIGQRRLGVRQ